MFRWDTVGHSSVVFGDPVLADGADDLLDACIVPLVQHDFGRATVLGCGTLIAYRSNICILTAAHLFESANARMGNLLAGARDHGATAELITLSGASVHVHPQADIALIVLPAGAALQRIVHARRAVRWVDPAADRDHTPQLHYVVSGYPAAWCRFERGWVAARRFTVHTRPCKGTADTYEYGRLGRTSTGGTIHTPAMEGMSGAGLWQFRRAGKHTIARLHGVQSAFMHGRYVRCAAVSAAAALLQRLDR